ncbi:MAG TPA: flagellar motor switch protein FliM [Steroidobacteraceae bacterium]|nr:flagellar motor switch protein FliM [Steroidobacteraceae bacterium]
MSEGNVLEQEEVDALLKGVDDGQVSTSSPADEPGVVRSYDFSREMRIVRGRMPTLEMINERFARLFRNSVYNMLRRSSDITVEPVQTRKFADYMGTLEMPTSLNLVRVNPLRGTALIVLEPKLVFSVVDNFFGGTGKHVEQEPRDFTVTESRIIQLILGSLFKDMQEAWAQVAPIQVEYLSTEMNPHFANIVAPSEVIVVSSFHLNLEGGGGDLHITMPYSMIEPLRDQLDSGIQGDRAENDDRWYRTLREEIEHARVELRSVLGQTEITLERLLNLQAGDILPIDFDGQATVYAEGVPVVRGGYGISGGCQAVRVEERYARVDAATDAGAGRH